jgi:general secretion pathway protein I
VIRPRSAPRRAGGFTLLEVMVALAILAGALLAVSDIVSGALRNHVRARNLEVATLLARGKLAALEDHYEAKGFKPSDEGEEGTFEDEGHPEVRWRVEVIVPPGDLGPEAVLRALTGSDEALQQLLPPPDQAPQLAPFQAVLAAQLQALLGSLGQKLKLGVREVRLTVSWPEGAAEESFGVTTYLVVLAPGEGLPQ